nr:PREDICTED: uncharacterized protein LOC108211055 [Daucus carota subsp. sativus]
MRSEVMEHLTQAILLNPASASLVYNARPSQFRVMAKGYSSIDDDSIPGLELDSDSETIIQDSRKVVLENNQIFAVSAKFNSSELDRLESADSTTEIKVLVEFCLNVDRQNMVSGSNTAGILRILCYDLFYDVPEDVAEKK